MRHGSSKLGVRGFVALFLLISLVPLGLLTFLSVRLSSGALSKEVRSHLHSTAELNDVILARELQGLRDLVTSYAGRPKLIESLAHGDLTRSDRASITINLRELAEGRPGIAAAFLVDPAGRLISSFPSGSSSPIENFSYSDWYRGATSSGDSYVSGAYRGPTRGNPMVVTAADVVRTTYGSRGKVIGVLGAAYRLDVLRSLVEPFATSQGLDLVVTDATGTEIIGPEAQTGLLVSKRDDPLVRAALRGRDGVSTRATSQGRVLAAYEPVSGVRWTVIASSSEEMAMASVGQLRTTMFSLAALLSLVLLGGLLFFTRTFRARRRAEDANAQLAAIVESSDDAVISKTLDGHITSWNAAAERLYGYSADEMIGRPISHLVPTGRADEIPALLERIERGESIDQYETVRMTKDARRVDVSVSLAPIRDNDRIIGASAISRDVTERKRAEDERDRFFTISLDMMCIAGFDGYFKRLNPAWERTLGYTTDELLAEPFLAFVHPDDRERTAAEATGLATGKDTIRFENRYRCKDGSYRWMLWTATPYPERQLIYAAARDITDRKGAEEALRASEARTRTIIETANDAFVAMDHTGLVTDWNHQAEVTFGWSRQEVIGRVLAKTIIPERYRGAHSDGLQRFLQTGDGPVLGKRIEIEAVDRTGREIPVELTVWPIEADGEVTFNAFIRDITDRKTAEEELHHQQQQLEAVFAATPDMITVIGPDGEITSRSQAMHELLGYAPEQFGGAAAFDIVHPEDRQLTTDSLEALSRGEVRDIRYRARHAEGGWVTLEAKTRIIEDAEGRHAGAVVVSRDVTEQARFEEALRQAKEEADRANQAKSEFLSRMSHELRTPLNAILGFGQLLEMDHLDEEQIEGVQHILKAGKHLLDLINEVLDISRIESGRLSISPEPVRVGDALTEALDLIAPLAAGRDVQLRDEDGVSDVFVMADRQRLKQVLLNLLANAVKYNREGGTVTVSCDRLTEGQFRLNVADTGPGIDPSQLDRLFTPFERLGAETSEVEGTGMGLALSKRLVELMGGEIGVESRPGVGSTFWVRLPVVDGPIEDLRQAEQSVATAVELNGHSRKVLYVEDNLSNLRLIERVLAHRPTVGLISAMQGGLGLDLAREHHPDLILLDLHLPDMPGQDVLDRLRRDPETADIPVIVISADATPGQLDRLLSAGADDYLTKPLDVARFLRILDETLNGGED